MSNSNPPSTEQSPAREVKSILEPVTEAGNPLEEENKKDPEKSLISESGPSEVEDESEPTSPQIDDTRLNRNFTENRRRTSADVFVFRPQLTDSQSEDRSFNEDPTLLSARSSRRSSVFANRQHSSSQETDFEGELSLQQQQDNLSNQASERLLEDENPQNDLENRESASKASVRFIPKNESIQESGDQEMENIIRQSSDEIMPQVPTRDSDQSICDLLGITPEEIRKDVNDRVQNLNSQETDAQEIDSNLRNQAHVESQSLGPIETDSSGVEGSNVQGAEQIPEPLIFLQAGSQDPSVDEGPISDQERENIVSRDLEETIQQVADNSMSNQSPVEILVFSQEESSMVLDDRDLNLNSRGTDAQEIENTIRSRIENAILRSETDTLNDSFSPTLEAITTAISNQNLDSQVNAVEDVGAIFRAINETAAQSLAEMFTQADNLYNQCLPSDDTLAHTPPTSTDEEKDPDCGMGMEITICVPKESELHDDPSFVMANFDTEFSMYEIHKDYKIKQVFKTEIVKYLKFQAKLRFLLTRMKVAQSPPILRAILLCAVKSSSFDGNTISSFILSRKTKYTSRGCSNLAIFYSIILELFDNKRYFSTISQDFTYLLIKHKELNCEKEFAKVEATYYFHVKENSEWQSVKFVPPMLKKRLEIAMKNRN